MSSDLLVELLQALDAPQGQYSELERYATGNQPLAFISPESRKALGNRLSRMSSNIPKLAVSSLVERLRISGFSDSRAWDLFVANDLDQIGPQAMTDALTYGSGFVLVWAKDGRPVASVESPREVTVLRDPADRSVFAAVKRYRTKTTTEAYVYLADEIQHHRANTPGAATAGFELVETIPHSLGVVPIVPIDNGGSEITDLMPLVDALNKLLLDMMCASEAAGKPRRWISGLELVPVPRLDDDGQPVLDGDGEPIIDVGSPIDDVNTTQTMIAEDAATKFGQLPASDLSGFEAGVRVIIAQIQAVSSLPAHYLSTTTSNLASADALRAAEASLTARCEQKQLAFGKAFEQVGRLLIAVASGGDPRDIPLRVKWADASTRSVAQEIDAAVKAYTSGLYSRELTLQRLGFSDDEITRELGRIDDDASKARDITMGRYMAGMKDN